MPPKRSTLVASRLNELGATVASCVCVIFRGASESEQPAAARAAAAAHELRKERGFTTASVLREPAQGSGRNRNVLRQDDPRSSGEESRASFRGPRSRG